MTEIETLEELNNRKTCLIEQYQQDFKVLQGKFDRLNVNYDSLAAENKKLKQENERLAELIIDGLSTENTEVAALLKIINGFRKDVI